MAKLFYAKILLFGEYSIIKGFSGMALPCSLFSGQLIQAANANDINKTLRLDDLYTYLDGSGILATVLDLKKLKIDIQNGMYFDSNIPHGHGVGSSGALCASIFEKYAYNFERKETYSTTELKYLQDLLALMESFYHGASSGLDCLISLINQPIYIESRNLISVIKKPNLAKLGSFYLLESGIARKTAPFVHQFLHDYDTSSDFRTEFERFSHVTDSLIKASLAEEKEVFFDLFATLSRLQYVNFQKMIPQSLRDIWLEGLESKDFYFKLCGAGGGGYFLIYSPYENRVCKNAIKLEW
ncbi:MAG: mevalonate kinase [Halobacteriovoraceae bacterium]|jgi:mevalonate kinase|nr:mevalonate kinase [Halobacteriovoraceae bacterium]